MLTNRYYVIYVKTNSADTKLVIRDRKLKDRKSFHCQKKKCKMIKMEHAKIHRKQSHYKTKLNSCSPECKQLRTCVTRRVINIWTKLLFNSHLWMYISVKFYYTLGAIYIPAVMRNNNIPSL